MKIKSIRRTGADNYVLTLPAVEYVPIFKLAHELSDNVQVDKAGYFGTEQLPFLNIYTESWDEVKKFLTVYFENLDIATL
jgi:hypothetical protein